MAQQGKEDCAIEACEVSRKRIPAQIEGPGEEFTLQDSQNRDVMSEEDEVFVDMDSTRRSTTDAGHSPPHRKEELHEISNTHQQFLGWPANGVLQGT